MIAHDDEPRWQTWRRRARTIPLLFCLALLALATLPVSAALAILVAPLERRRGATLRCVGFFTSYLFGEMLFLMLAFGQWVAARPWTPAGALRLARWTEWLCNAWFGLLHASGQLFFELRIEVTGLEALDGGGPLIMMLRHCSMGDTPLAPVYLGRHQGLRLRLVAKHELLGDPLLDVLGGRMRSCFVRRGSSNTAHEVEAVCALLDALGPRDAVVIYPEGTRFSPANRRARSIGWPATSIRRCSPVRAGCGTCYRRGWAAPSRYSNAIPAPMCCSASMSATRAPSASAICSRDAPSDSTSRCTFAACRSLTSRRGAMRSRVGSSRSGRSWTTGSMSDWAACSRGSRRFLLRCPDPAEAC